MLSHCQEGRFLPMRNFYSAGYYSITDLYRHLKSYAVNDSTKKEYIVKSIDNINIMMYKRGFMTLQRKSV
jgi:hypothetical protein